MARARRPSDEAYNARRRFKRQAERLRRQAAKVAGVYKKRLESLAASFQSMAHQLYKTAAGYSQRLIRYSQTARAGRVADQELQAEAVLKSHVGARIWAANEDVWRGLPYDERESALLDAFGVGSVQQLIELLEVELGEGLYAADTAENYDEVVTRMMELRARG